MNRKSSPDFLKGIAVVMMVQVHLTELFARAHLYDSAAGKASLFFGGPPAAPVFMAVMGYFLAFTSKSTVKMVLRGAKLLVWGLLLNLGLNAHLVFRFYTDRIIITPAAYIFGVDILFLAGLSVIIIALLKPLFRGNSLPWAGFAVSLALVTPYISKLTVANPVGQYFAAFVGGTYEWSYFPLFPWLAYPVAGYVFALAEDRILSAFHTYKLPFMGLAAGILTATSGWALAITCDLNRYYHHGPAYFAWTILFIAFWTALLSMVNDRFEKFAAIRYLRWTGAHVTNFYVFQWLIIGNLGTWLFKTQNGYQLLFWFLAIMTSTSILVYYWSKQKENKKYNVL